MNLDIIGAGLGRTGTYSLKAALEYLGIGPCLHMKVRGRGPKHNLAWLAAARGEDIDWQDLFHGFRSAVDWPVCNFYARLARQFPNARFILTTRDEAAWYRSIHRTIFPLLQSKSSRRDDRSGSWAGMAWKIIGDTFDGRFDDREHCLMIYRSHRDAVIRSIGRDRLLVFDVAEGWAPLCKFVGCDIPTAPFPFLNRSSDQI